MRLSRLGRDRSALLGRSVLRIFLMLPGDRVQLVGIPGLEAPGLLYLLELQIRTVFLFVL